MKKYLIYFNLLLVVLSIQSQDYKKYEVQLINRFAAGESNNRLKTWFPLNEIGVNGPNGFCFADNNIVFLDYLNGKIKKFSNSYEFLAEENISVDPIIHNMYFEDGIIFVVSNLEFYAFNEHLEKRIHFRLPDDLRYENNNFFFIDNILLISTNNNLSAILNPQADTLINETNIVYGDELKYLLMDISNDSGVDIIQMNYNSFFIDLPKISTNFDDYYDYWYDSHGVESGSSIFSSDRIGKLNITNYLGIDFNGNEYWRIGSYRILILNEGTFIEAIEYDSTKSRILPVIHPNGDIYFLDYDEDWVYLYKIENVWDPH